MMTLREFSEKTGLHITMASRIKNGKRLPSVKSLQQISKAFKLPYKELIDHHIQGAPAFGAYIREKVFNPTAAAA